MKKIFVHTILFLFVAGGLFAQQLPTYTEYFFDKAVINPACVGAQPYLQGTLAYRSMFSGIEGAPVTQFLSVHTPWQTKNLGLGLTAVNDKAGALNTTKANLNVAYYVGLGKGKLSMGLSLGILNYALNASNLIRTDLVDQALDNNKLSKALPDAAFGLYYQTKNYFVGYSAMQLLHSKANLTSYSHSPMARLYTHNFITAGATIEVNEKIRIEPSTLLKTVVGAPFQYDINLRAMFINTIGGGISYRSKESVCGMLEVLVKDGFRVGLAYDKTISKLSSFSKGSVELMLSYRKKLMPPAREREMHPRYYVY